MTADEFKELMDKANARYEAMTPEEKAAMRKAQRESWVRGMTTPCEHGMLDFEQCPECRKEAAQMKHIGHTDGAMAVPVWKTHTLGMLSAQSVFIPNPGERENVDAEKYQHIGWIDPNKDGGTIFETHAEAGDDSRPAYILRPESLDGLTDAKEKAVSKLTMSTEYGTIKKPLPVNTWVISTDDLIKEVLEFCNEELDGFDGPEYDSDSEVCCQCANVYLRELVRRVRPAPNAAPPIKPDPESPPHRSEFEALKKDIADLARIVVELTRSQSTQPVTFYDHAFIASYMALMQPAYGLPISEALVRAHKLAAELTRNRANPT